MDEFLIDYECFEARFDEYEVKFETEDFIFPSEPSGRGSRVEALPEGKLLTDLDDLEYFQRKIWTSLKIPSWYMSTPEEKPAPNIVYGTGSTSNEPPRFRVLCLDEIHEIRDRDNVNNFDRAMKIVKEM